MTKEDEQIAEEMMGVARAIVIARAPYWAPILYSLVPYAVENFGSIMGVTEGMVMMYDPVKVREISKEEYLAFIVAHEVGHVFRDTFGRCGHRDHHLFNLAADMPDNEDLVKANWEPPIAPYAPVLPETYGFPPGLTAEDYYDLLLAQEAKAPKKKGAQSKIKIKVKTLQNGILKEIEKEQDVKAADAGDDPHPTCGLCGGIAGNKINPELEAKVDAEVGRGIAEKRSAQKQTIEELRRFVAKGRGTLPSSLMTLLKLDGKKSRIPWRRKFRHILRRMSGRIQSGGLDFSLSRPSRGSYARGIPRPGTVQQEPEIVFIEDTSGSMGQKQAQAARREAAAIINSQGIDYVWWLDADAALATKPRRIRARDLGSIPRHGGGGTDFRPAIEAAMRLKPKPDIIVYLTDGDGTAPATPPPGVAFIWCIIPSYYNKRPAEWGHAVIMRDEDDERSYPKLEKDEEEETDD